jgi:hypothetical protein
MSLVQHRFLALIAAVLAPVVPAAAQQLQPRTIDLKGIIAVGAYTPLKPRTIDLREIYATGTFSPLEPRTIDLKGINAQGSWLLLKPRTIDLKGITAAGVSTKISKTIQLPGWTAAPPPRGKRL